MGAPVLAAIVMATGVATPPGIAILFFLLPALWFIRYLVGGAAVGTAILRTRRPEATEHPYMAVLIGLLILQVAVLIPFVGGMIAFFAGLVGGGALLYRLWAAFRGTTEGRPAAGPIAPAAPAA